ncbi:thioredoxin family protein [Photobacterium lutimaris]|uniref:Thioredoxin family protein n=1 Tax=Photobacterium lutimaris TaxID=388278 RepID=A0A2T3IZB9_9GAMM|nr:thioredoxin family protein [Photobacterium lutimaris]PSU34002.1 thioredoxin family protein [Photobacterium lutimaris]TDR76341.1 small redox-active disulfide protein 2 [Photobacterium lutimaris]
MKNVKVLGSGCKNCKVTAELIQDIFQQHGIAFELEKIEDMAVIMAFGVMSTPAVVIDDVVVHKGSVPKRENIEGWLTR